MAVRWLEEFPGADNTAKLQNALNAVCTGTTWHELRLPTSLRIDRQVNMDGSKYAGYAVIRPNASDAQIRNGTRSYLTTAPGLHNTNNDSMIRMWSMSNVWFMGLQFNGNRWNRPRSPGSANLEFRSVGANCGVLNSEFYSAPYDGIVVRDCNSGLYIGGVRSSWNGRSGITISSGRNIWIEWCDFQENGMWGASNAPDFDPRSGITLEHGPVHGCMIQRSWFRDNGGHGARISEMQSSGLKVERNWFWNNRARALYSNVQIDSIWLNLFDQHHDLNVVQNYPEAELQLIHRGALSWIGSCKFSRFTAGWRRGIYLSSSSDGRGPAVNYCWFDPSLYRNYEGPAIRSGSTASYTGRDPWTNLQISSLTRQQATGW